MKCLPRFLLLLLYGRCSVVFYLGVVVFVQPGDLAELSEGFLGRWQWFLELVIWCTVGGRVQECDFWSLFMYVILWLAFSVFDSALSNFFVNMEYLGCYGLMFCLWKFLQTIYFWLRWPPYSKYHTEEIIILPFCYGKLFRHFFESLVILKSTIDICIQRC